MNKLYRLCILDNYRLLMESSCNHVCELYSFVCDEVPAEEVLSSELREGHQLDLGEFKPLETKQQLLQSPNYNYNSSNNLKYNLWINLNYNININYNINYNP